MDELIIKEITSPAGPLSGETIKEINAVSGGCIHQAWHIELHDCRQFFAKTTSKESFRMLEFEADSLSALNEFSNVKYLEIPKPIGVKSLKKFSIHLMPWLNLSNGNQENLGKGQND